MALFSLTDLELLDLIRLDDAEAFQVLYKRHWRRCFGLAYQKLGDKEAVEEAVQAVFVSLWDRRKSLQIAHLESYIAGAVKYQVLNHFDALLSKRRLAARADAPARPDSENAVENAVFLQDLKKALDAALLELPDKTRMIYEMSRFEQLPQKEIARQLDLSEKAVEYHIGQALRLLRERLKDFLVATGLLCFFEKIFHFI